MVVNRLIKQHKYRIFLLTLICLFHTTTFSQIYREPSQGMALSGVIKEYRDITIPIPYAKVVVKGTELETYCDGRGFFVLNGFSGKINSEVVVLLITAEGYNDLEFQASLGGEEVGVIFMHRLRRDINPITVNDLMPSLHQTNSISSFGATALFWDSNNMLSKGANMGLGLLGYKMRGYDWSSQNFHINGANMNEPEQGYAFAGLFAGLNDFTHKGEGSSKLVDNSTFYGSVGGYNNININPLSYKEQFKLTYGFSNSLFSHQTTVSYSTGVLNSGWALNIMASGRLGNAFMDGTDYKGFSYLFSAAKELAEDNYLNFFILGAPTERGMHNDAREEEYTKYGYKYNSAWGKKANGKKLNSRKNKYHQPIIGIENSWGDIISEVANLRTSLSFSFGDNAQTALNWAENATNPIPGRYNAISNTEQVDWSNIFTENSLVLQSKYIIENRISNRTLLSFNSVFDVFDWGNLETTSGIEAQLYNGRFKKEVDDLLGSTYWLDVDKFAPSVNPPPSFYQNNILNPNKEVNAGEPFGYDYSISQQSAKLWTMWRYYFYGFKFSAGASASYLKYEHTSEVENGKLTDKAKNSKKHLDYSAKIGAAYKLNMFNSVEINAYYSKQAPNFTNAFVAPRVGNLLLSDLKQEQIMSAEINYALHTVNLDINASIYYTQFTDRTLIRSDYSFSNSSYLNMALHGVKQTHMGLEVSAKYSITDHFSANLAFSKGNYKYKSNPYALLYQENTASVVSTDTVGMDGLYIGGTPQMAISLGALYTKKDWWAGANINFTSNNYMDTNPYKSFSETPKPQEKLKSLFTLDLHGGYTYEFGEKRVKAVGLNVNIQNLLGTKGYLGAYEPFGLTDTLNEEEFTARYARAYGRTLFLILSFRF